MEEILLGYGVFSINGTDVALTRGGGKFMVERTYKEIIADGDYGPVKERIRLDRSVAKLTLRALELLEANLPKMYPATSLDTTTVPGTGTLTGTAEVAAADYQDDVTFTGVTMSGKDVTLTIENGINLENLEWDMIDKDEVVAEINYTATYLGAARKVEPWKVDYVTP